MSTEESKSRVRSLFRRTTLAVEATGLNASAMWLEIRLWWAKKRILWMLGAIDDARDRMHHACRRDADRALRFIKRSTPIGSIGLSKVIVSSLERAGVSDLSDLNPNVYKLESIPNIGPARSKSIIQAYHKAMKKAALEACLDPEVDVRVQHFVLFRSSINATVTDLCRKQEILNAQSDDFLAEIGRYSESLEYRALTLICWKSLLQEITAFLEQVRLAREKTAQGGWVMPPDLMSEHTLKSLACVARREITFRFDVKYLKEIEIRDGSVVS